MHLSIFSLSHIHTHFSTTIYLCCKIPFPRESAKPLMNATPTNKTIITIIKFHNSHKIVYTIIMYTVTLVNFKLKNTLWTTWTTTLFHSFFLLLYYCSFLFTGSFLCHHLPINSYLISSFYKTMRMKEKRMMLRMTTH